MKLYYPKYFLQSPEHITDAVYMHTKGICIDFKRKNLVDYLDLFVQGDTLLLANVRVSKYMNLILFIFLLQQDYHGKHYLKTQSKIRSIN